MSTESSTRIRQATNADRDIVTALIFGILREYRLEPDPSNTDADLADLEAHYLTPGGIFDVLEDATGSIIGTVGLVKGDDRVCLLRKMYLHPDHRGRGLGKTLLKHALKRAHELGFRRVQLETASVLVEAVALYRAFGFEPIDDPNLPERCDGALALDLLP